MILKDDPLLLEYRSARQPKKNRLANRLVRENEPLVRRLVTKLTRFTPHGVEFEDCMQVGFIGFMYALDHIDTTKTFSTYLNYRIWFEIAKLVAERGGGISQPRGVGMPYKVVRAIEAYRARTGRDPQPEDVGVTEAHWRKWANLPSMDAELDMEDQAGEDNPETDAALSEGRAALKKALPKLPLYQRRVVALLLRDMEPKEIAQKLDMTAMAVALTTRDALATLRRLME